MSTLTTSLTIRSTIGETIKLMKQNGMIEHDLEVSDKKLMDIFSYLDKSQEWDDVSSDQDLYNDVNIFVNSNNTLKIVCMPAHYARFEFLSF